MPSGIAARSAACSTGLIRTVGGAATGSTVSRPTCSSTASAARARPGLGGTSPPARRQLIRASERERPRHCGCRRTHAGRLRRLLPPAHEMGAVLAARQRGVGDHRAGLGQRDGLQVQVLSQFDHTVPLVRVGRQASAQIANGLTQAERPDRHDPHATGDGRGVGGGHQYPAGRADGPQTIQVRRVGQVIEYHQPRTAGLAQPAEELGGNRLTAARLVPAGRGGRRRGVAGQHSGPARGLDPDQQVYTA